MKISDLTFPALLPRGQHIHRELVHAISYLEDLRAKAPAVVPTAATNLRAHLVAAIAALDARTGTT